MNKIDLIFMITHILNILILLRILPMYKVGIPLFFKNSKMLIFIYMNKSKLINLDNTYENFLLTHKSNNYVIVWSYTWMFHVYEGSTCDEILFKYDIGGQSNKADYLTFWEKYLGNKLEKYYLSYLFKANIVSAKDGTKKQ